jgi:hypothetical protein
MATLCIPREALERAEFIVSVDEDGDVRAEATVTVDTVTYTIVVEDPESWDDGSECAGSAAFFKEAALQGKMQFTRRGLTLSAGRR